MICFSLPVIEDSLRICKTIRYNAQKRMDEEQSRYKQLKAKLQCAENKANEDKRLAESERDLCQTIYDKNKSLSDQLNDEKNRLKTVIAQQESEISQLEAKISYLQSALASMSPPRSPSGDDPVAQAAYNSRLSAYERKRSAIESEISGLEARLRKVRTEMENNKRRVEFLTKKIEQIKDANAKLMKTKESIVQAVTKLNQYIKNCRQVGDALGGAFAKLTDEVRQFVGTLNDLEGIIKEAQRSAEAAYDALGRICSEYAFNLGNTRIEVDSIDSLESLDKALHKTCMKLGMVEGYLLDCTNRYCERIQDAVSKDVNKIVSDIDQKLKEIYDLLEDRSSNTEKLKNSLNDYLKVIFKIKRR